MRRDRLRAQATDNSEHGKAGEHGGLLRREGAGIERAPGAWLRNCLWPADRAAWPDNAIPVICQKALRDGGLGARIDALGRFGKPGLARVLVVLVGRARRDVDGAPPPQPIQRGRTGALNAPLRYQRRQSCDPQLDRLFEILTCFRRVGRSGQRTGMLGAPASVQL
jgi:hypothetical protein